MIGHRRRYEWVVAALVAVGCECGGGSPAGPMDAGDEPAEAGDGDGGQDAGLEDAGTERDAAAAPWPGWRRYTWLPPDCDVYYALEPAEALGTFAWEPCFEGETVASSSSSTGEIGGTSTPSRPLTARG